MGIVKQLYHVSKNLRGIKDPHHLLDMYDMNEVELDSYDKIK